MPDELIPPVRITEEMKGGLARLYADNGIKAYLVNAIGIANQNVLVCLKAGKLEEAKDYGARLDALQKLLEKGKSMYQQAEKLKVTPLEEQIKEKQHEQEG